MEPERTLVNIDRRGRVSLGRLGAIPGRYLGEVQSDGSVVLHPAEVTTRAQVRLLARPDIMTAMDEMVANPSIGLRRERPARRPTG